MDQEIVVGQPGPAGDDDVRWVPDPGRRPADVGGQRLGDEERRHRHGQPLAHQERHRAISSTVVTLSSTAEAAAVTSTTITITRNDELTVEVGRLGDHAVPSRELRGAPRPSPLDRSADERFVRVRAFLAGSLAGSAGGEWPAGWRLIVGPGVRAGRSGAMTRSVTPPQATSASRACRRSGRGCRPRHWPDAARPRPGHRPSLPCSSRGPHRAHPRPQGDARPLGVAAVPVLQWSLDAARACGVGRHIVPTSAQWCSGLGKSKRQPASHAERWLPCAGMPPASVIMRAMWSRFQVMNAVLRLVKSFSGPPLPGSR